MGSSALILNAKARDPANNNWEMIPQKSTFLRVAMRNTAHVPLLPHLRGPSLFETFTPSYAVKGNPAT